MKTLGTGCILLYIYGFLIINLEFISTTEYHTDGLGVRRNAKEFSLFSVVTFKNEECTSETSFTGGVVKGTCYSVSECSDKEGQTSGNCASGFGVCCVFISNVGTATISENRTYLQSLLFPAIETSVAAITYTINKMQSDVCQLRLDFDNFAISGPTCTDELAGATSGNLNGGTNCADTLLTTLTSNQIIPTLCGTMTGSHLYLDLGMDADDTATLALAFAAAPTAVTAFRSWRIKTAQIPCWATYRAPDGCHQYMTGYHTGMIWSPNFRTHPSTTTQGAVAANAPNYRVDLMGLDLKYCIRREKGMCCTLFQVCNQDPDGVALVQGIGGDTNGAIDGGQGQVDPGFSFQIDCVIGTAATVSGQFVNIGLVDEDCTADYVEIPDSTTGIKSYGAATNSNSRYCCNRLGFVPAKTAAARGTNHAPVWDCTEPFEVLYHTDMYTDELKLVTEAADGILLVPRGLCLVYKQDAC